MIAKPKKKCIKHYRKSTRRAEGFIDAELRDDTLGRCPVCKRRYFITLRGAIRMHSIHNDPTRCSGSGRKPLPDEED